jgi:hypothetical protein
MELVTVRIPELVSHPGPLSLDDRIPIWYAEMNKTRKTSLSELRTFILTGGTGSFPPVYLGGSVIYIVPPADAGGQIASIPALAGKSFLLRRQGRPVIPQQDPAIPEAEYEILYGGGFKLLQAGDVLIEGERYELDLFSLQGGSGSSSASSTGSSLIKGQVPVTTNLTLNSTDHLNKLISIRANTSIITVTLPDIDDVPDNTIIPIETAILNTYQARITTQGGQYIYMRNNNYTRLYMGISESIWLYRGEDGWYVINDFAQSYERVGKVEASYKVGINEILASGDLISRAAHPRLWEYVQTLGASLVSEATWQTVSVEYAGRTVYLPFRGCYSTGDGVTNFRVPHLMNMGLRGVESLSGSDPERYYNKPGGFQRNEFESHNHNIIYELNGTDGQNNGQHIWDDSGEPNTTGQNTFAILSSGGSESRMDNVGVLWTIKE